MVFGTSRIIIETFILKEYFTYNEKVRSFFILFLFLRLFLSFLCYLRVDPIKSCLFLVLSLLVLSPFISFGIQIWYSYFICIIFLRGIFVILVYFTRISKYNFYTFSLGFFIFIGLILFPLVIINLNFNLYILYIKDFVYLLSYLIFSLFLFINFSSYFLNFSGALRKL